MPVLMLVIRESRLPREPIMTLSSCPRLSLGKLMRFSSKRNMMRVSSNIKKLFSRTKTMELRWLFRKLKSARKSKKLLPTLTQKSLSSIDKRVMSYLRKLNTHSLSRSMMKV